MIARRYRTIMPQIFLFEDLPPEEVAHPLNLRRRELPPSAEVAHGVDQALFDVAPDGRNAQINFVSELLNGERSAHVRADQISPAKGQQFEISDRGGGRNLNSTRTRFLPLRIFDPTAHLGGREIFEQIRAIRS